VVWNVEKVLKQDAPQFDPSQVGVTASRMPTFGSARKIDDMTVELITKEPDSFLPIISPICSWRALPMAETVRRRRRQRRQGEIASRLGRLRKGRFRHRPLENVELHAARAA